MWRSRLLFPSQNKWASLQNYLVVAKKGFGNTAHFQQQAQIATKAKVDGTDFKVGCEVEGFLVQEISDIPEFQLRAIRLYHEDTGAQYIHLHRDDSNNAFSINLRTTPFDSTGVPHILEHTTLCGSKKYPCRDPFFKMLSRSLATYMNALTGPDHTLYPFSTQNQKDYYNLMSVYMDAVFNPQLKESDFRQEGWRLEHEVVDDPKTPIVFKGVVFNEMKGALSENQRVFYEGLMNKLLPSHTYGVISGGDPLHIPQLTYEQLKAFHSQYYHPSNARLYSYGNQPLRNHLKFINEHYLNQYGVVKQKYSDSTKVPPERRWSSVKKEHMFGKKDTMAPDPTKQGTIALSYLCSDITDIEETFVLQVLSELLISGPNSAFYKSLIEPNIASGFSMATGFESQTKDTFFAVGLQGLNPKDFDWMIETCDKTIDKVISEGFDSNHIEAVLHNIELNTKHQSSDFGLRFLFSIGSLWNHDGDVIKALRVNDTVTQFRQNLSKNPKYLQEKVVQYLKNNNHKLIFTMTPDEQYEEKKIKQENELLQSKISELTLEMKKTIFEDGIKLRTEQDHKQNVDCLPTLKSSDLKKDIEINEIHNSKIANVPVQVCIQPTNYLTYMRGIVNISHIGNDVKPFLPLFTNVATKMGSKKYNYRELAQIVELKTGGLSLTSHIAEKKDDTNSFEEGILFSSYSLDSNANSMFSLWEEIFNHVTFEDKERLETLMKATAAHLVSSLADHGHLYVMGASAALVNPSAQRSEQISGLSYVKWLCNLVQQNVYHDILSKLEILAKEVFSKRFMRLAVNVIPENQNSVEKCMDLFLDALQGSYEKSFVTVRDDGISNRHQKLGLQYESSLPVSYASKSIPTVPFTHSDYAPLRIMCALLSSKFLLPMVREKGGAYGAGARLTPAGVISFYSYRDPKPAQTFNTFDASLDWMKKLEFSEQDVEEAKLRIFQNIDAPIPPGARGLRNFLYGISEQEFKEQRSSLMTVKMEDVLRVAHEYLNENQSTPEGRVLLGPLNEDITKRPGEKWTFEKL